ncbi:hypothetical protein ERJ75_000540000 [Trypanosoma vivax]|nr:hypothetical protein ERJ75_000540000 [Trypanosoma vivax]
MNETAEELASKIGVAARKAMTGGIDLTAETKDSEVKARLGSNQANTDALAPKGETTEGEDLAHVLIMLCNHGTTNNACGGSTENQCPCVSRVHKNDNRLAAVRSNTWTGIKASGGVNDEGRESAYGKNWDIALELCQEQNAANRNNNDTVTPSGIRRDIMDLEATLVWNTTTETRKGASDKRTRAAGATETTVHLRASATTQSIQKTDRSTSSHK